MKIESRKRYFAIIFITPLLVVAFLLLGYQLYKTTEQAAFDEFNKRQLVLAREAAGGIKMYFENLSGDMRALARHPDIQRFEEAPARKELQYMLYELEQWGVNDIAVLDANGFVKFNVAAHELEGDDFSWRKYFQEAKVMAPGEGYIIEFIEFQGVEAGDKGVVVAVPMYLTPTQESNSTAQDSFAGVVLCTLRLNTITEKFVSPIRASADGHAFLLDGESHVLWTPDESLFGEILLEVSEGFPAFHNMVQSMISGNSGSGLYSYFAFDDTRDTYLADTQEEKLIAYAPIELGNDSWSIGVWAPTTDARQLVRSAYFIQLLIVGLCVLTVLGSSAYLLLSLFHSGRTLEKLVEDKTGQLRESNQRLVNALNGLETAHAFLQSVIDGVAESIMVIDSDYQAKLMNRAAREFSGMPPEGTDPIYCYQVSHQRDTPCDGVAHPCPLDQVLKSGKLVSVIHEHNQANGDRRIVEVFISPLWGPDGSIQGIIESTQDITERLQAEKERQQYAERLRSVSTQLAEVAELERQQLARELHDQVGQNLTALGLNLNIVRSLMPEDAIGPVRSRLDDSLSLVEETTERIRDVMADLRPPVLDDYGLVAALQWYGEQFTRRTGIPCSVIGKEPDPRLPTSVENALFRIVQEALTNVAKHAQATQATVTVEVAADTALISIADDGIGFDSTQIPEPDGNGGWGLLIMNERAEAVGGRCRIESQPNRGASVRVEVDR